MGDFTEHAESFDDLRVRIAKDVLARRREMRYRVTPVNDWDDAQQAVEDVLSNIIARHVRGTRASGVAAKNCNWCSECPCGRNGIAWPCLGLKQALDALVPRDKREARQATRRGGDEAAAGADDVGPPPEAPTWTPFQRASSPTGSSRFRPTMEAFA